LATATLIGVAEDREAAGTSAVSSVEETKVVEVELPFSRICDEATKLLPVTVIAVDGDPVAITLGETEETTGIGLSTENDPLAGPPPGVGFVTTTE
jgi:hypothetical protein